MRTKGKVEETWGRRSCRSDEIDGSNSRPCSSGIVSSEAHIYHSDGIVLGGYHEIRIGNRSISRFDRDDCD